MAGPFRVFVYEYVSAGAAAGPASRWTADLLESGASMRDALTRDLVALDGVAVTRATRVGVAHARPIARALDVSARVGESDFEFVSRIARAHDVAIVVAPESDGILAAMHGAVGAERWLGCTPRAIAIASSKSATRQRLAAFGVATPAAPGDLLNERDDARWIVKPDDGAGSIGARRFERLGDAQRECERRLARGETSVVEAWVPGDPLSLTLVCARGRARLLGVNRQHIAVDGAGNVRYVGVSAAAIEPRGDRASALADVVRHVASAIPGLHGFVGIDFVDDPLRGPVVIEVNPRVTCAYVGLSAALGRNVAADLLQAHGVRLEEHADR